MTPKNRERAYEKRRYEEWQQRLAAKQTRARRTRQRLAVGSGALLVVVVTVVAFLLMNENPDEQANSATEPAATPSAAASTCPPVDVEAPQSPQQFAKVPDKGLAEGRDWTLQMSTTCGDIEITLDGKAAPQAVSSMIQLARDGFYDGSPCHRLTTSETFKVLQCGDPTGTGTGSPGYSYGPIENAPEQTSTSGGTTSRTYPEGTVAMARARDDGGSMGSQFFLVYGDTAIGDDSAGGYTVLGRITKGLDVVKKVAEGGENTGTGDGPPVSAVSVVSTEVTG